MFSYKANGSSRYKGFPYLLLFLLVPFIIYFYFLKWKASSLHDDDLYIYHAFTNAKGNFYKINVSLYFGQYRPIRDFFLYVIIQLFDKDFTSIYIFNVIIQSINTIIFAHILNLYLRSLTFSVFLSLILGLSRFCFYNVTQLFNGGVLEGLAMMFFLLFLLTIVKIATKPGPTIRDQRKVILWSILLVNLSLYVHERYIVLMPFVMLMILVSPTFKGLPTKYKAGFSLLTIVSIVLNIFIKYYFFSMPFLTGSGNIPIKFSFSSSVQFLLTALASICQLNIDQEYVSGLRFHFLPAFAIGMIVLIIALFTYVFVSFLVQAISNIVKKRGLPNFPIFVSLGVLFFISLVPIILQVRIELRWLQAPLSILILMFVIAMTSLKNQSDKRKYVLSFSLGICFLCTNYYYIDKGAKNLYYSTAARIGNAFDKAIKDSIVHLGITNLYIWEKTRSLQREDEIKWTLANGYFFEPYSNNKMNLIFTDSLSSFSDFNKKKDGIIYIDIQREDQTFKYSIVDLTGEYLRDSLRNFNKQTFGRADSVRRIITYPGQLTITNDHFSDFITDGFYENENGIRWTNGNATIAFNGDYIIKDSLQLIMNTYLPAVCKNIIPKIVLIDTNEKKYETVLTGREGDNFKYTFYFAKQTAIQKINILSEKIDVTLPDQRTLSFPFISVELKRQ